MEIPHVKVGTQEFAESVGAEEKNHSIGKTSNYNDLATKIETIKNYIREYGECAGEEIKDEYQKMIITIIAQPKIHLLSKQFCTIFIL